MSRYVLLDIGGTSIKTALFDKEMGEVKEYPTDAKKGADKLVQKVIEIIESYEGFEAIGISTAGQVDFENGSIIYANENMPGYTGTKWREILSSKFNVPVYVENDVNSAAMGEGYKGAAKDVKDYLCLTYGTGVGGAIVIDHKVYHGAGGSAGEFGALLMNVSKHEKGNAFSGAYEKYGSTTALVNKAKEYDESLINGRVIFEHLDDPVVKKIISDWCLDIALGLTSLIHIFNPELVVLGGGIMEQKLVFDKVNELVFEEIMPSYKNVKLKQASLGNKAGLYGALAILERNI